MFGAPGEEGDRGEMYCNIIIFVLCLIMRNDNDLGLGGSSTNTGEK